MLTNSKLSNIAFINLPNGNFLVNQPGTLTVWIVDDDEDDQMLIRAAFKAWHPSIKVSSLSDGAELLLQLVRCTDLPRLILLDVNMPRKNGFDALKELRSVTAYADLSVVMLTTSSEERDRQHSLALGANHFLTKPLV